MANTETDSTVDSLFENSKRILLLRLQTAAMAAISSSNNNNDKSSRFLGILPKELLPADTEAIIGKTIGELHAQVKKVISLPPFSVITLFESHSSSNSSKNDHHHNDVTISNRDDAANNESCNPGHSSGHHNQHHSIQEEEGKKEDSSYPSNYHRKTMIRREGGGGLREHCCPEAGCGMAFPRRAKLTLHLRQSHRHNHHFDALIKPYRCTFDRLRCSFASADRRQTLDHIRTVHLKKINSVGKDDWKEKDRIDPATYLQVLPKLVTMSKQQQQTN